jgi:hypothetical protein
MNTTNKKTAKKTVQSNRPTSTGSTAAADTSIAAAPAGSAIPASISASTGTGPAPGLAELVNDLTTFLDQAEARLGPEPVISTTVGKRRVAKPRKGFEKVIGMIAPIVQQHQLESPSLNTSDMMAHADIAQTLTPLQTRLLKISKRVGNETFNAQTSAWNMGLQFYSLLKRRALGDGELAQNIEPLTRVFSYRHPLVRETKPLKVETRAKAKLKSAIKLAGRHGVAIPQEQASGTPATTAPASAVAAGHPEPRDSQRAGRAGRRERLGRAGHGSLIVDAHRAEETKRGATPRRPSAKRASSVRNDRRPCVRHRRDVLREHARRQVEEHELERLLLR